MTQQPYPQLPPQPYAAPLAESPQDAPVGQDPRATVAAGRPRWSGRRTAVVGAIVLGLTTIGGVTAAVASPDGIAAPTENSSGFGPGGGRGGFGGGQFGPGRNGRGQGAQQGQNGVGGGQFGVPRPRSGDAVSVRS